MLRQNADRSGAWGNRQAMPMIAIGSGPGAPSERFLSSRTVIDQA
jgi:hypothetical protein